MNLYFQLGLILVITWYLFYFKEKSKIVEKMDIYNYQSQYKLNSYDLNDLSLTKPKHYYPLDFDNDLDKKKLKYFKAVNDSLDRIRLLANRNQETIYNTQDRNPTPIEGNSKPFEFIAKYLENKMNDMGRNLYKVSFDKFNNIEGEEIDDQYKVNLEMNYSINIRKESYSDNKKNYTFKVKTEAVINKANPRYNTKGNVFFRTLFVDDDETNEYRGV
jgi:hypothetical protein